MASKSSANDLYQRGRTNSVVSKTSQGLNYVLNPPVGVGADFTAFGETPAVKLPTRPGHGIPLPEEQPHNWFNVFQQADLERLFRIWHWNRAKNTQQKAFIASVIVCAVLGFSFLMAGDPYVFPLLIPSLMCLFAGAFYAKKKFGFEYVDWLTYFSLTLFFLVGNVGSEMANKWTPRVSLMTVILEVGLLVMPPLVYQSHFTCTFFTSWTILAGYGAVSSAYGNHEAWFRDNGAFIGHVSLPMAINLIFTIAFKRTDMVRRGEFLLYHYLYLENRELRQQLNTVEMLRQGLLQLDDETKDYIVCNFDSDIKSYAHRPLRLGSSASRTTGAEDGARKLPSQILANVEEALTDKELFNEIMSVDDKFEVDIFAVSRATNSRSLKYICEYWFTRWDVYSLFTEEKTKELLMSFICDLERGYHKNPYHNSLHAADVVNTSCALVEEYRALYAAMTLYDKLAVVIAAAGHDYDHPGVNNGFLQVVYDDRAILHNNRSVLERHHASSLFRLLHTETYAPLREAIDANGQYQYVRNLVISLILSTDMKEHFNYIKNLSEKIPDLEPSKEEEKDLLLQMTIKFADIAHVMKSLQLTLEWTARISAEFFQQGDRERENGQQISPFMDRETMNIPKNQIGFITFVIKPFVSLWAEQTGTQKYVMKLEGSRLYWAEKMDQKVLDTGNASGDVWIRETALKQAISMRSRLSPAPPMTSSHIPPVVVGNSVDS